MNGCGGGVSTGGGYYPGYYYGESYTTRRSGSWLGGVLCLVAVALLLWWFLSSGTGSSSSAQSSFGRRGGGGGGCGSVDAVAVIPSGSLYGAAKSCTDPQVATPPSPLNDERLAQGATRPLDVDSPDVASIGGLNLRGGSAGSALDGAFEMTDVGKEYMAAYNPTGLASVMPAGWKTQKPNCLGEGAGAFAEFSRYSISPEAVAKSENMRSVLRLSENTRNNQGRITGYNSLLRNAVTPIGPTPIGDKAMLWNGSSIRDGFIAASTGKFPDLALC